MVSDFVLIIEQEIEYANEAYMYADFFFQLSIDSHETNTSAETIL